MVKKICFSKKITFLSFLVLGGLALFVFISNSISSQKLALNSKAATPKSKFLRPCGFDGGACCGENKCNDGLTCDITYDTCSPSTCGEDGEVCCGDIGTTNRCDSQDYSCTFSNYKDQICRQDPNRFNHNADTFCGKSDTWPDGEICAKLSGMTHPNPVKFKAAFLFWPIKNRPANKKNPTIGKNVMYMSELIHVAAPAYQLFIDCDNDKVFEKTKYADLDPTSLTDYVDDEGNVISRKINTSLSIPFYCVYNPEKLFKQLPKSLRVNVIVRAIRSGEDPIDDYFSFFDLDENQIKYWANPESTN